MIKSLVKKHLFFVLCLFSPPTTLVHADEDTASLRNYSKGECKDLSSPNGDNWGFRRSDYDSPWLRIRKVNSKLTADFRCGNGKTKHLVMDIGSDTDGGEAVKQVNCDKNFLLIAFVYKLGEGSGTTYLDLQTCEELGSGDDEHYSPDQKILVLTSNGTDAGYTDASLNVIDCRGEVCKKLWGGTFNQDLFSSFKWITATKFTVERYYGDGPTWLCTFDVIKTPKLLCKKK